MRSAEAIAADSLSLPADERAALVLRLAESLDEQHDEDAEDAWAAEVAVRIETVRAGTATITDNLASHHVFQVANAGDGFREPRAARESQRAEVKPSPSCGGMASQPGMHDAASEAPARTGPDS